MIEPPVYRPDYPVTTFVIVSTVVMLVVFHWMVNEPAATGAIVFAMGLASVVLFVVEWFHSEETKRFGDKK